MHVIRSDDGDEPEEDQHEQLPETVIGKRIWAAGVRVSGGDRRDPDNDNRPPSSHDQRDSGERGDREADVGTEKHAVRRQKTRLGHAQRAEARRGVGAAPEIDRVVHEIRADLDEHRAEQCAREARKGGPK